MVLQESGEMYLETIYILAQKSPYVRSIDVTEYPQCVSPTRFILWIMGGCADERTEQARTGEAACLPDDRPILPEKTRWKGSLSRLRRFEHLRPAAQRQVPLHGDKNLLLQL